MEQQLQVTSGNLLQVERSLASVASSTSSHASYRTSMSTWHAHHAADDDASPIHRAGADAGAAAVDAVMLVRAACLQLHRLWHCCIAAIVRRCSL